MDSTTKENKTPQLSRTKTNDSFQLINDENNEMQKMPDDIPGSIPGEDLQNEITTDHPALESDKSVVAAGHIIEKVIQSAVNLDESEIKSHKNETRPLSKEVAAQGRISRRLTLRDSCDPAVVKETARQSIQAGKCCLPSITASPKHPNPILTKLSSPQITMNHF